VRDAIIEAAGALFTIGALGYIFLVLWYLMTHQHERPTTREAQRIYWSEHGPEQEVEEIIYKSFEEV
jgi:hypothetical protein